MYACLLDYRILLEMLSAQGQKSEHFTTITHKIKS